MANQPTTTISTVQMDDGVRLHVKLIGDDATASAATKKKPLLIALHGAPGLLTHAEPEGSYAHLAGPALRVLVFDARGSGKSDLVGPYSHERWIRDIESLRRWAGAETFILAGGSYGGFLALDYALAHGDRLRGLVLTDTWADGVQGTMTALVNLATSPRIRVDLARLVRVWSGTLRDDKDYEEAIKEILPIYSPPSEDEASKEAPDEVNLDELGIKVHSATQNAAFGVNMPRFNVRHRLHEIKAPTLVIVGRHDIVTPLPFNEEIAKGISRARLEIFEHSGHMAASDEPERFQQVVGDFLKNEVL